MELHADTCYQALLSHDRRFDGLFFTCVSTTGIYCRPICPAKPPKISHCSFVHTAAEAEKAGYRPCMRCRPELAPGALIDTSQSLPYMLAQHIDDTLLLDQTLAEVAQDFSVSDRHLRRLFAQAYGVDPKDYLMTRRLLFAKQLIQDTTMPILQIAYASGFRSPDRLTINMQKHYNLTPTALRKRHATAEAPQTITLRADYRPPFNWHALLDFLAGRATPLERVTGSTYYRIVDGYEIAVSNKATHNQLLIHLPVELSRQAYEILRQVRKLFDLDANPQVIEATLGHDPLLDQIIAAHPGLRVPGCWDNFEMLLRVIIGQQVSVAGATTIMRRLADTIGLTPLAISRSSPAAIAALGMPKKRAATIWSVGVMVHEERIDLSVRDPHAFHAQLISIPGIGRWTVEYLQMRVLHWPDAFPAGDLGLQKAAVPGQRLTERQLRARADSWQPWRSYAAIMLWKSLVNKGG